MKRKLSLVLLALLGVPLVKGAVNPFETIQPLLINVFYFLNLSWIQGTEAKGNAVLAIFFITLIVLIEHVLKKVFEGDDKKKIRIVIAIAFSSISIIFIPKDIALIAGTQYGSVASFLLIAGLPLILLFRYYKHVSEHFQGNDQQRRYTFILWLLYIILAIGGGIAGWTNFQSSRNYLSWAYSSISSIILLLAGIFTLGTISSFHLGGSGVSKALGVTGNGLGRVFGATASGIGKLGGIAATKIFEQTKKIKNELKEVNALEKRLKDTNSDNERIQKTDLPKIIRFLKDIKEQLTNELTELESDESPNDKKKKIRSNKSKSYKRYFKN